MKFFIQTKKLNLINIDFNIQLVALLFFCLFSASFTFSQGNFLDTSSWTLGSGSAPGFNQFGEDENNERILGTDPYGSESIIWKASAPAQRTGESGGWDSDFRPITDKSKSYRFTVWIKKEGVLNGDSTGETIFGFSAMSAKYGGLAAVKSNGVRLANAHFYRGFLPEINKWYLMVGFVRSKDFVNSDVVEGAIYDTENGQKIMSVTNDFKLSNNADLIRSGYKFSKAYNIGNKQYYWNPSIYETTDASMPSIEELLQPSIEAAETNGAVKQWAANATGISYTSGNVGIGTVNIEDWKLAVGGKIRAEEVRVEAFPWPDYVFKNGYIIPSLDQIKAHIEKDGHLMNIPSAKDVKANGIELGEMNRLLLEKIEELTLHLIDQRKLQIELEKEVRQLELKLK